MLIYPQLGFMDSFIRQIPLSLIYAATDAVKAGYDIELVDFRVEEKDVEKILKEKFKEDIVGVGISVISGKAIKNAMQISNCVKKISNANIIWGGSFPTVMPKEVLSQKYVDFVIRGYGSGPFRLLLDRIFSGSSNYDEIPGICYKKNGDTKVSEINSSYEFFDYKEIPYRLIDKFIVKYFSKKQREMPIYTAVGCPYSCAFCISPLWYRANKRKWISFDTSYVVNHMAYLIEKYGINYFYLYDDDSFVEVNHFLEIAREIKRRKFNVKIGVRGIRVNEIDMIKDDELGLLEEAGITTLHIGVESGSQKMLDLMKKDIKVEQSIAVNRRLAKFQKIIPYYNLMSGLPTETIEDLKETKRLMLQLTKDNPACVVYGPFKFIPCPGTELYDLAVKMGFKPFEKLEDWGKLDQESDVRMPWYKKDFNNYLNMLHLEQNILDNRLALLSKTNKFFIMLLRFLRWLYSPIGKLRLKYDFADLLIEYKILKLLS